DQVAAGQAGAKDSAARICATLDKLGPILAERRQHVRARELAHTRERWVDGLKGFTTTSAAYPIVKLLRYAIRTGDYDAYVAGHPGVRGLGALAGDAARRRELPDLLEPAAPAWTAVLRKRVAPHHTGEPPGNLDDALAYRLLEQALAALHAVDLEELLSQLTRIGLKLKDTTARYVQALAWRAPVARTAGLQAPARG